MKKTLLSVLLLLMGVAQGTMAQEKEAYAVLNDDYTVLTFYYDTQKAERYSMSVGPFEWDDNNDQPTTSWYPQGGTIKTVVFDASFADCTSLTSTAYWFYGCSSLTTITGIENLKTDNVTDMSYMFYYCWHLTNLAVSGFKTDNVTNMSAMFYFCSHLTNLNLSGFKTANVTNMSWMFKDCFGLTSLDVSGFKTDNVTDMYAMFGDCSSLTTLDLSGFKTDNVTDMYAMFGNCTSLTSLDVSGFNTANVTNMSNMFERCESLASLDLSNFKTDNVTNMNFMFYNCSSLTTIYASNDWNTEKVESGSLMFSGCTNLVGGQGTAYDAYYTNYRYARIDGGEAAPGYFTYEVSTGIGGLKSADAANAPVYDLSGRRVTEPAKGIVVKNGKKYVNK